MENEIEELYDLESDPDELRNLAVERAHRRTLESYRGRMEMLLRRTNGRLMADRLPRPRVV